jgi:transcription antitermination factor NusG
MPSSWGIAISQPQRHRIALDQLQSSNFEFFQPWREQIIISHGKHRRLRIPYFGRYIFVVICEAWAQILKLRGIASMLLNPETLHPLSVDLRQLQAVRSLCDRHGIIHQPESQKYKLHYGDQVYAEKGPFANLRGVYDCRIGKHREAAVFTMFGAEQRVLFKLGELKVAA